MVECMAERYGMLPSQVLSTATTHDIQMFIHSMEHRNKQTAKSEGRLSETYKPDQLEDMLTQWRSNLK